MSWREALDLTSELAKDPSSHVAAAIANWQFPASFEYQALRVIADNYTAVKTAKRNAQLRILPDPTMPPRRGTARMSAAQMRDFLDQHRRAVDLGISGPTTRRHHG